MFTQRKTAQRKKSRRPSSVSRSGRWVGQSLTRRLHVEQLEDRRMLAVITVDSLADNLFVDGEVTLREAIAAANTNLPVGDAPTGSIVGDTIRFAAALSGQTITLGGAELSITEALTIDATALAENVTIDANNASRIFNITTTGGFVFDGITLAGLTLTGGRTTGDNANFSDTTFSGGAIRSLTSILTIVQSTISGNSTTGDYADGGGIFASSVVTLTSSTISGNSTTGNYASGGGIRTISGDVTLTSSTVSGNSSGFRAGGILSGGTTTITNSIVAGNTAGSTLGGTGPDLVPVFGGTLTINYSLIGVADGLTITGGGNLTGTAALPLDPLLGPLANNGGRTETHALLVGSPAIDAGDPSFASPPDFDQRGAPFVRVFGGRIDIGAFEVQPIADSADFDSDGDIDGADFLAWQRGLGTPSASPADGDANNDNSVDGADLSIWEAQFGGSAPVIALSTVSSEPPALELYFTEPVAFATAAPVVPTISPANLIDAALAMEWLGAGAEEEKTARAPEQLAVEAAFTGSPETDWLLPGGHLFTEFGLAKFSAANASSADVGAKDASSAESGLAEELLERVFA